MLILVIEAVVSTPRRPAVRTYNCKASPTSLKVVIGKVPQPWACYRNSAAASGFGEFHFSGNAVFGPLRKIRSI
jgi:hypothetical protein